MRTKYSHPEARNLPGKSFGLEIIDRLSELSLLNARSIEWHSHEETEVICCLKGGLRYEFRKRLDATVAAGCFLVIPSGLPHRLADGIDGPCRRISFFLRNHPGGPGPTPFSIPEYRDLLSDILRKRLCPRALAPLMRQGLSRLADLVRKGNLGPRERVEIRTFSATAIVSFAAKKTPEPSKPQVRLIDEAIQWLQAHFQEKVSLDQLTTFMGYSQSRLCELFKSRTGFPPMEWLIRHRLDKACELLKSNDLPIAEIAHGVGFDDPLFFSRVFHKRLGFSPRDYQKRFCEKQAHGRAPGRSEGARVRQRR